MAATCVPFGSSPPSVCGLGEEWAIGAVGRRIFSRLTIDEFCTQRDRKWEDETSVARIGRVRVRARVWMLMWMWILEASNQTRYDRQVDV